MTNEKQPVDLLDAARGARELPPLPEAHWKPTVPTGAAAAFVPGAVFPQTESRSYTANISMLQPMYTTEQMRLYARAALATLDTALSQQVAAPEQWESPSPEAHSKALAAGDLMAVAEEAGAARLGENIVQCTRDDLQRIIAAALPAERAAPLQVSPDLTFDQWLAHPYTKVLQDSIAKDYIPRDPAGTVQAVVTSPQPE